MVPEIHCIDCPKAEKVTGYDINLDGNPPSALIIPNHLKRNCEGAPEGRQFASIRATCINGSSKKKTKLNQPTAV